MMIKVLECLQMIKDVGIGLLIPDTLTLCKYGVYHSGDDGRGGHGIK